MSAKAKVQTESVRIPSDSIELEGLLAIPDGAAGIVLFAHGSGSSRLSPRNMYVADALQRAGVGTLLFDLLTEEEAEDRENVFDVDFLGHRLGDATRWLRRRTAAHPCEIGYFGASTGAAAALIAAAQDPAISAVVSRGGRPDLAMRCLPGVKAATMLIVGGNDTGVIELNERAYECLGCEKQLIIVPGATHLFEEPGTLDAVVRHATKWFKQHLARAKGDPDPLSDYATVYANRAEAGRALAAALLKFKKDRPIVLGIPRGGVPVALEVARALDAELDVIVVRKLGAPNEPELGIGAIVDGDHPESVLNQEVMSYLGVSREYLDREIRKQLKEIHRRQQAYRGGRPPLRLEGRTVIVVDDGIATGGSTRAALRGARRAMPARLVLAVPVAPPSTLQALKGEADEIICLSSPEEFFAVGQFYRDFHQVSDEEVIRMLEEAQHPRPAAAPAP
ncbi:MAG TPA: phosphoribosyltransferase [Candidatus Binataceae bacterium]|nr:phosphoribosyltransferase [Candidatus Binataceae bacterium]